MKRVVLVCILTAVALGMMAQPRLKQPEMYIGMHGGVLFSMTLFTPKVAGSDKLEDRVLLSGNGGLMFRYIEHKYCGFQVELDYMQRGWRENTEVEGEEVNYTRRLNYLEMPFMAHFYFGKKAVRGFFNLGPQIGVCFLDNKGSGTINPDPLKQAQYAHIDNIFDWGVTAGLGMLLRTTKVGTFQLEARFSYSLGDYFSNKKTDPFSHSNPMTLSANVGYLWEIKRKR